LPCLLAPCEGLKARHVVDLYFAQRQITVTDILSGYYQSEREKEKKKPFELHVCSIDVRISDEQFNPLVMIITFQVKVVALL